MRILWVKADKLLPVQSGGNIRSYHIVRELTKRHEVTFFSYYDGACDPEYERALHQQFPSAVCLCTGKRKATLWRRSLDFLRRLPDEAPYAVARFRSAAVRRRLRQWDFDRAFDVAVCDFLDAAVNFPERPAIPAILFQHNVESEIWRRHVVTESNWARKLMYRMEFAKMLRYEQRIVRKFDHVIAVSEHDRNLMNRWVDASRLTVVPTGVDLQQFHPDPSAKAQEPVVMFVGAMDWEPNIDAVEYFCGEIWSGVQARVAGARLRIVGRNPNRRIQKLASSSIEVTGAVPSIGDHLREAAVVVVPLRVGGGTRLKIYEAMATGKAVVSTSVGAEGLDVHHGRDIVLADTSSTFAEVVVSLLENADLRNRYGRAAAQTAAQFGWPVIARKFGNVLETIAGGQRPIVAAAEQRLGGMTSTRGQGVI